MMVSASATPSTRWLRKIQIPATSSQSTLSAKLPTPAPGTSSKSWPNGTRPSLASLKHCSPKGMPTTVRQSSTPASRYSRQISQPPPRMTQRTLRRNSTPDLRRTGPSHFRSAAQALEQALGLLADRPARVELLRPLQRGAGSSTIPLELERDPQVQVRAGIVVLLGQRDPELGDGAIDLTAEQLLLALLHV